MRIGTSPSLQIPREASPRIDARHMTDAASFENQLVNAVRGLESQMVTADQTALQAARGEVDVHQAALALEKADLQLRMMVKVRNKVVDAYREIMRLSV